MQLTRFGQRCWSTDANDSHDGPIHDSEGQRAIPPSWRRAWHGGRPRPVFIPIRALRLLRPAAGSGQQERQEGHRRWPDCQTLMARFGPIKRPPTPKPSAHLSSPHGKRGFTAERPPGRPIRCLPSGVVGAKRNERTNGSPIPRSERARTALSLTFAATRPMR